MAETQLEYFKGSDRVGCGAGQLCQFFLQKIFNKYIGEIKINLHKAIQLGSEISNARKGEIYGKRTID